MVRRLCVCLIYLWGVLAAGALWAGEFNTVLNIGDQAPAWKDLPGVDGKKHSLADLKDKDIVVVVFTCNSCPFAVEYEDRIIAFAKKYATTDGKVALLAINVNKVEADSFPKMQERAKAKGFPFPYIYDESQKIARDFGATFTPEFYVLNKERRIAYMGGFDDNSDASQAKMNYLHAAVDAVLQGTKPAVTETLPRGCRVRYVRERSN